MKQIFISGNQDSLVPIDYVKTYIGFAQGKGEHISFHAFDETGHFEVIVPSTEAGKALIHSVPLLLNKTNVD